MSRARILLVAVAALASGCVSTPAEAPRVTALTAESLGLGADPYASPSDGWWRQLGNPALDALVEDALAHNPGLAGALARVRGAQEQAVIAGSTNSPQVALDASATRERVSANYIYPPPFAGGTFWEGRLGADFGWNLDFFGRQAALIQSAD